MSNALPSEPSPFSDDEFTRLYLVDGPRVFGYLSRRVGPTIAEDLTAETFVLAWEGRHRFDPSRGSVRAWVFGIATHLMKRHHRDEERQLRAFAATGIDPVADAADHDVLRQMDSSEQARRVALALSEMKPDDRSLLLLHHVAELSVTDIAAALGRPVGTVTSRLSRARTHLRRVTGWSGLD